MKLAIFGASGGIGSELCRKLETAGIKYVPITRTGKTIDGVAREAVELRGSNWDDYSEAVAEAAKYMNGLSGFVNTIGSVSLKPIHMVKEAEFHDIINTNLLSSAAMLSAAIPWIRKSEEKQKSVIFLSSVATGIGLTNHALITAAKAGVEGLMRGAAATYAKENIRINTVAPGLTQTPMTKFIFDNPTALERSTNMHPLGRTGLPDDIVNAVMWLLEEKSSWITGQVLRIDGGLSTLRN